MIPQLIFICLTVFILGIHLAKHGEPRDEHNFLYALIDTVVIYIILYYGGFFNVFK